MQVFVVYGLNMGSFTTEKKRNMPKNSYLIPYTKLIPVNTSDGFSLHRLVRLEALQKQLLNAPMFDVVGEYCFLLLGLMESMQNYAKAHGGKHIQLFTKLEVIREGVVGNSLAFELAYWVSNLGLDCYFLSLFRLGRCLYEKYGKISHPDFDHKRTQVDKDASVAHLAEYAMLFSVLVRGCLSNIYFMERWTGELVEMSKMNSSQAIIVSMCSPKSMKNMCVLLNGSVQAVLKASVVADIKVTSESQKSDYEPLKHAVSLFELSLECTRQAVEQKSTEEKRFLKIESFSKTLTWLRNITVAMLCYCEGNLPLSLWYSRKTHTEWFKSIKEKLESAAEITQQQPMSLEEEPKDLVQRFKVTACDLTKVPLYLELHAAENKKWPEFVFRDNQNGTLVEYVASAESIVQQQGNTASTATAADD